MTPPVRRVLVAIFASFAVQIMVLVLVPLKAVDIGEPATTAAMLVAAWGLLGIVLDLPAAALSDEHGRGRAIATGGLILAVAALVLSLAWDLSTMLAGMLLFGVGQAFTFGPALALLTEVTTPQEHARVQGVNGALQGVSSISAALLAGLFAGLGFLAAFLPVTALSLVVVVAVWPVPEAARRPVRAISGRGLAGSYARALRMAAYRPNVTFASLLSVLYAIVFLVVAASMLPLVLVEVEGYSPLMAGLLLAVRNLASALLSLTFATVTRHFGVVRTLVRMSWLSAIGTALLAITTSSPPLILLALFIHAAGMAYGAAGANILVAQATSGAERALGMSATTVASRLTVLVVPLIAGPLIAPESAAPAFLLAAGASVAVILVMHRVARRVTEWAGVPTPIGGSLA